MKTIYLDTCSWINLFDDQHQDLKQELTKSISDQEFEIIISHAVNDEIKTNIEQMPKRRVAAGCFIVGYTRVGEGRLGDVTGAFGLLTQDIPDKKKNRNSVWDAIHFATAQFENVDFFVSDDEKLKRKIRERIKNHVPIISTDELKQQVSK